MGTGEQELTVKVEGKGFEKVTKQVDRLVKAEDELAGSTEEVQEEAQDASDKTLKFGKAAKQAAEGVKTLEKGTAGLIGRLRSLGRSLSDASQRTGELTSGVGAMAFGMLKLGTAVLAASRALRIFRVGGALLAGLMAIGARLRGEIVERQRLARVIEEQSAAMDLLNRRRREEQAQLERVAGMRRRGGFEDAQTSRQVQAKARAAKAEFTQLQEGDIGQAYGLFGDVGLSDRKLVRLAIIAGMGGLGRVDPDERYASLRIQAEHLLKRYSGRIEKFARRETEQGQGLGWKEYRPQVTERAAAIAAQAREQGLGTELLRERLRKMLMPGTDIEKAIVLYQLLGTASELEEHKVGVASPRGITALINALEGKVEVGLPEQAGYLNQLLGFFGATKEFMRLRDEEFKDILKAFRQIEREGLPGVGSEAAKETKEAAQTLKEAAQAMKEAAATGGTIVYMQHARIVYPDAEAVRKRSIYGENDKMRRQKG